MSGYEDAETGELIGERAAAWEAGDTTRGEAIDEELTRRLRDILRDCYPYKLRPAGPLEPAPARPRRKGRPGTRAYAPRPACPGPPASTTSSELNEDSMLPLNAAATTGARIWSARPGGNDSVAVGGSAAAGILEIEPWAAGVARQNRAFPGRAVRFPPGEAGLRPFPDVGCGLSAGDSVHDAVQPTAPGSRITCAGNDRQVPVRSAALLTPAPEGRTPCGTSEPGTGAGAAISRTRMKNRDPGGHGRVSSC